MERWLKLRLYIGAEACGDDACVLYDNLRRAYDIINTLLLISILVGTQFYCGVSTSYKNNLLANVWK